MADGNGQRIIEGTLGFEDVTPALAKEWLERRHRQRPIRSTRVAMLVRAKKTGAYAPSGDPIAIGSSPDFFLLNGQHRCQAVVDSGMTWRLAVWRNCPLTAVFDIGAKRTHADRAALQGMEYPKEWASICGAAHALWNIASPSFEDLEDAHELVGPAVDWAVTQAGTHRKAITGAVMAGFALVYGVNPDRIEALFAAIVGDGAGLAEGSAELVGREWFKNRQRGGRSRVARAERSHETIAAIWLAKNACQRGTGRMPAAGSPRLLAALEWLGEARIKKKLKWKRPAWLDKKAAPADGGARG